MIAPNCSHADYKKNGKTASGVQRYKCKACGHRFTDETRVLGGMRIGLAQAERIIKCLCEGMSARATARIMDCDVHTVIELMNLIGERCQRFMESEISRVCVDSVEIDEAWQFIGAKQRTADRDGLGDEYGDSYVFIGIERSTKLVLAWHLGKRDQYHAEQFCGKLSAATAGRFTLSSDGFTPYRQAVPNKLAGRIDYGMLIKIFGQPPQEEQRRYSPAAIRSTRKESIWGNPSMREISTSICERNNLNLRTFNRRYTRLSNGFSKKWSNHEMALSLQFCHYNYVRRHGTLKTTPAVASGLTDHEWTVRELILETSTF